MMMMMMMMIRENGEIDYDDFYSQCYCIIDDYISKNNDSEDDSDSDDDDNIERFKRIDGYDNYSVLTFGRIRNDASNHILKLGKNGNGYYTVGLSKKGKSKTHRVHRLVGLTFIPNRDDKPMIHHIDGDRTNNHIRNLCWASSEENTWNRKSSNPLGKGVCNIFEGMGYEPTDKPCMSIIYHRGKKYHLGFFKTAKEASNAYEAKAKELHGDFYYKNKCFIL